MVRLNIVPRTKLQLHLVRGPALTLSLHSVRTVGGVNADTYEGPHAVTPTFTEQALKTAGKRVQENIQVHAIPIERVANPAGGYTIIVGG